MSIEGLITSVSLAMKLKVHGLIVSTESLDIISEHDAAIREETEDKLSFDPNDINNLIINKFKES